MIGIALKFFKAVIAFVLENWRWILPLVLGLLLWWFITSIQGERDDAIKALADYKAEVQAAADARKLENERKQTQAIIALNAVNASHLSQIEALRRKYESRNQTDKAAAAGSIDLWRERVRLEVARNAAGLPAIPETAGKPAEVGGDRDAATARQAYDNLELACAITTSDFNALWDAWSKSCEIYGCR